jgi:hypothetical protein
MTHGGSAHAGSVTFLAEPPHNTEHDMPSYRTGHQAPAADRAEGADLDTIAVADWPATHKLIGAGLDVVRVTARASQLDDDTAPRAVVWHRQPDDAAKARAAELLSGQLSHVV